MIRLVELVELWCDDRKFKSIVSSNWEVGSRDVAVWFIIISKPWANNGVTLRFVGGNVDFREADREADSYSSKWPKWRAFCDINNPEFFPRLGELVEENSDIK